eukprot:TRINITY_DN142_c0_g1_i1.p1 TRINITY_DN142_c0_g1~~TRINITY_DN142_c0_g1_i1.p1  ORF type:complete len:569 (+),score=227.24 TRINITY_DN142_c0_g1_i1:258-1964(+)
MHDLLLPKRGNVDMSLRLPRLRSPPDSPRSSLGLFSLFPAELIQHVLSYFNDVDVANIEAFNCLRVTCRCMRDYVNRYQQVLFVADGVSSCPTSYVDELVGVRRLVWICGESDRPEARQAAGRRRATVWPAVMRNSRQLRELLIDAESPARPLPNVLGQLAVAIKSSKPTELRTLRLAGNFPDALQWTALGRAIADCCPSFQSLTLELTSTEAFLEATALLEAIQPLRSLHALDIRVNALKYEDAKSDLAKTSSFAVEVHRLATSLSTVARRNPVRELIVDFGTNAEFEPTLPYGSLSSAASARQLRVVELHSVALKPLDWICLETLLETNPIDTMRLHLTAETRWDHFQHFLSGLAKCSSLKTLLLSSPGSFPEPALRDLLDSVRAHPSLASLELEPSGQYLEEASEKRVAQLLDKGRLKELVFCNMISSAGMFDIGLALATNATVETLELYTAGDDAEPIEDFFEAIAINPSLRSLKFCCTEMTPRMAVLLGSALRYNSGLHTLELLSIRNKGCDAALVSSIMFNAYGNESLRTLRFSADGTSASDKTQIECVLKRLNWNVNVEFC